jgi:hypothetical protein
MSQTSSNPNNILQKFTLRSWSGISIGSVALLTLVFIYRSLHHHWYSDQLLVYLLNEDHSINRSTLSLLIKSLGTFMLATVVMGYGVGSFLHGSNLPRVPTKTVFLFCFVVLLGGIVCWLLLLHRAVFLLPGAMVLFYGLALLQFKHSYKLHYLAMVEITIGLVAMYHYRYGPLYWGVGFGFLHLVYGFMTLKDHRP